MTGLRMGTMGLMAAALLGVLGAGSAAQAKVYFGIGVVENDFRGGMQIVELVEGGPAWKDGQLRPLDLITAIDGNPVQSHKDMEDAIAQINPGDVVRMDLEDRFGTPFWINITPDKTGVVVYMAVKNRPDAPAKPGKPAGGNVPPGRPGSGRPGRP
jgi:S1-C subfamily serine protease